MVPRLVLFLGLTGILLPLALLAYPLSQRAVRVLSLAWFKGVCRICNLSVQVHGEPVDDASVLFVGNHVSYLDIPVLGTVMNARFVAKQEVAGWPLFGICARVARTIFIKRDPKEALRQREDIRAELDAGERLILFPEGTSTDGKRVLPFKSTLFSVADQKGEQEAPVVQPFSIVYPRYADGRPLDRGHQSLYAWHGDHELFPHLISVFGLKGAIVDVIFHPPVKAADFAHRKDLAQHCHTQVARGVQRSHGQRIYKPKPVAELSWTV